MPLAEFVQPQRDEDGTIVRPVGLVTCPNCRVERRTPCRAVPPGPKSRVDRIRWRRNRLPRMQHVSHGCRP
jgi:hypothetical protein